jgi:FAD synthase/beta-phosphoglucomutase-like phosphatase (HAD superfamily)
MIILNGIKNIIFDFGGVLVDLDPQACLDAFAGLGIPQVSQMLTPYGHKGPFGDVENGNITIDQFRDKIREQFNVSLTDDQIDDAWAAFLLHIPINKIKMVSELASQYRVFLLSNTNPVHIRKLKEFEENGFAIDRCFEKLYLSYELGMSKPGKEIFLHILKDADIKPEETLLVDDGPANCKSAQELGFKTYQPQPFEDFTDEILRPGDCVATMGFFDGVHEGHKYLIKEVNDIAFRKNLPSLVLNFWPHPRTVINSGFYPQLLTTKEERSELLNKTGADYIRTIEFNNEISLMSAKDFMQKVLKDEFNVSTLVIGYDHRFGNDRTDGFEEYLKYGEEIGIEVIKSKPYIVDKKSCMDHTAFMPETKQVSGEAGMKPGNKPDSGDETITVSSSVIRRCLLSSRLEEANMLLGRPYSIKGTVVGGKMIGRTLGFPTANIELTDNYKLIPSAGVYAVWVNLEDKKYKGMLNIGRRPTLKLESDIVIEVHILNFSGNLYGKELEIEFVKRLRSEELFTDIESLVKQLQKDKDTVETLLS